MALKYDVELELKSPAEVVWSAIKDLNFLFPKVVPNIFESIEILEGDGKSPGTMRFVTYAKESGLEFHFKSKLESVDEENKTVHYSITESELLKYYKYFEDLFSVKAKGEGSVVVWTCMYEKEIFCAPDGDTMKDIMVEILQKLDAFLLGNNKT